MLVLMLSFFTIVSESGLWFRAQQRKRKYSLSLQTCKQTKQHLNTFAVNILK